MASPAGEGASRLLLNNLTPPMSSQNKRPVRIVLFDIGHEMDGFLDRGVSPALELA